jgi:hypothetical protein
MSLIPSYRRYRLSATVLMLPFTLYFEGDRVYSAVLPILSLALLRRLLAYKAECHNKSKWKANTK